MKSIITISALVLLAGTLGAVSADPSQPGNIEERIVTVRVPVSQMPFAPGEKREIRVELEIAPGFHVNSDRPDEEFLIPTSVSFKPTKGLTFGKAAYPAPKVKTFGFSEEPLSVFEGRIMVAVPVTLAADFEGLKFTLSGVVSFQACDDFSCRAPDETEFQATFPVSAAGRISKRTPAAGDKKADEAPPAEAGNIQRKQSEAEAPGPEHFLPAAEEASPPPLETKTGEGPAGAADDLTKTVRERGMLLTFVLVFLGGLALNLTPCVYPLIPITISYFGGQAGGKKGGLLTHALLYVLGMAVTYSVLGTLAALTGSLFGQALRYPAVLIGIAVVLAGLALSMFDVYEFRLPGFLTRAAGSSRRGFLGTFFMGLTVGVVAAPCIGPFILGLLTYVGDRGNVLLGFWLFFLLALGLGAPFVALAFFSGSLNRLPRSGSWMVWVRKIFGFILLAMAVYFLRTLFADPLLYSLIVSLVLFLAGIYLAWLEPTTSEGKAFPLIRILVGIAFFAVALFTAYSGISRSIDRRISDVTSRRGEVIDTKTIAWIPYAEERLREAAELNKHVFIDFYADWCIPCRENDDKTFSDPEIAAFSRRFVMLKADMTSSSDPRTKRLEKQYNLPGVPTLIFLGPDGRELGALRRAGYVHKKEFLELMNQALAAGK